MTRSLVRRADVLLLGAGAALCLALAGQAQAASTLPVGADQASTALPANPQRIAVTLYYLLGDVDALGYKPACAVAAVTGQPAGDNALEWQLSQQDGTAALPPPPDATGEDLAACHPDLVIDGTTDFGQTSGTNESLIAPTLFVGTGSAVNPLTSSGAAASSPAQAIPAWKTILWNVAAGLGGRAPVAAQDVIAIMDRRAAAIRGQLAGKTYSSIAVQSAASFIAYGPFIASASEVFNLDLGLEDVILPVQYNPTGCVDGTTNPSGAPEGCSINVSAEDLEDLSSADVIFSLQTNNDLSAFESDPLFTSLPAVKANRLEHEPNWDLGVTGTALAYASAESAFGLREYHVTVGGKVGAQATVTFDSVSRRACWSLSPTAGRKRPAGKAAAITLTTSVAKGKKRRSTTTVSLSTKPRYVDPEQTAPGAPVWATTPVTYESNGCTTLPRTVGATLARTPSGIVLHYGGGSGRLQNGAASFIAPTS